jgi:hypothetical protein
MPSVVTLHFYILLTKYIYIFLLIFSSQNDYQLFVHDCFVLHTPPWLRVPASLCIIHKIDSSVVQTEQSLCLHWVTFGVVF